MVSFLKEQNYFKQIIDYSPQAACSVELEALAAPILITTSQSPGARNYVGHDQWGKGCIQQLVQKPESGLPSA